MRLVIGPWLKGSISLLVIDPDEESGEVRKRSRWSSEEISRFSSAKRLTYVGDHAGASALVSDLMETGESRITQQRDLQIRKTESGTFIGGEEERRTPDGRELKMFRGIETDMFDTLRKGVPGATLASHRGKTSDESGFVLETFADRGSAVVRSIARDGSMFEVQIS